MLGFTLKRVNYERREWLRSVIDMIRFACLATFSCPKEQDCSFPEQSLQQDMEDNLNDSSDINSEIFFFHLKPVLAMYFGVYFAWRSGLKASVILHNILLSNILKCPLGFFDVTPTGRVLARFSHDINTLDDRLINNLRGCLMTSLRVRWHTQIGSVVNAIKFFRDTIQSTKTFSFAF